MRAAPIAELPGPCICEAPCEKSVYLWSCPGQKVFIVNKGTAPVTLKSGSVLAGWFKGKWQLHKAVSGKEVPEPEEADLLFELTGSSDNVLMGATYMTLGQVIAAKRACAPADAFIGFHEIQDAPTDSDVKAFKAVRGAHALHFRPDTVQMKTDQEIPTVQSQNFASLLPSKVWSNWCTQVTWSMRWPPSTSKGLQPVRPFVTMKANTTIPAGMGVDITSAKEPAVAKKEEE